KNRLAGGDDGSLPSVDTDSDTLTAAEEAFYGTDPTKADTDGDSTAGTSLKDNEELYTRHTDPLVKDTDRDGFDDGVEIDAGTNPLDPTDHGALPNLNLAVDGDSKYRPQAALDGNGNIHVVAGMSSDSDTRIGFHYYM